MKRQRQSNYDFWMDTAKPWLTREFDFTKPWPTLDEAMAYGRQNPVTNDQVASYAVDMASPFAKVGGLLGTLVAQSPRSKYGINKGLITVKDPVRVAHPDIYARPDEIAKASAANTAEELPEMQTLFGVTRDDLYEMSKGRTGNMPPEYHLPAKPKGAASAEKVTTPKNTQRVLDTLAEAGKYPELHKGMDSWYIMDPAYKRLVELLGPEEGAKQYARFNAMSGMASPGSDVLTEINRGTGAMYLDKQGRFGDFLQYGGMAEKDRGRMFPADMRGIMGHPYHSTSQAKPMQGYLETGGLTLKSPKVPLYIQASGAPNFQQSLPVGDAHFSRGIGLADTRTAKKNFGGSISTPELTTVGPWWNDKIASELGLNPVQAQARAWGTFAPATGVDTPVGAPKLELLTQKILDAAKAYNIPPEQARDLLLTGEIYAPNLNLLKGGLLELPPGSQ